MSAFALGLRSNYASILFLDAMNHDNVLVEVKNTGDTSIQELTLTKSLRLKCHRLNPLTKYPKEAETGNGSYIMDFMLFGLKFQEQKLS